MSKKTLEAQFNELQGQRSQVLDRMYYHAGMTIPSLFPDRYYSGTIQSHDINSLYSNKAGRNVMLLAAFIVTALYPPNDIPFFELVIDDSVGAETKQALIDPVAEAERAILNRLQVSNFREALFTAIQHSEVMGDSLIHQVDKEKFKTYHPAHFQIRRDGTGEIQEYWTVDFMVTDLLPDDLKNIKRKSGNDTKGMRERLYTRVYKDGEKWKVEREFREEIYERGTYEVLPYFHFGWTRVAGEDYSRSIVEENIGTIVSLELTTKALVEGTVAGSEGRILLDPGSTTTADDFIGTDNWSIITARPGSVDAWQPQVGSSLQVALAAKAQYEAELDEAFMTRSAGELTGERVTAFQTNQVVSERNRGLGGILATLEQNIEGVIRRTIHLLTKDNFFTPELEAALNEKELIVSVASGIDAMGRQMDTLRIEQILTLLSSTQDPEIHEVFKKGNLVRAYARNSGMDMTEFTNSEDEINANRQATRQNQVEDAATQQAIQTVGTVIEKEAAKEGSS